MEPMIQKILPVMAQNNRLLGTVALDSEVTFSGVEETVMIKGNLYPVQHTAMRRSSDMSAVHFMCIYMDPIQEKVGMQNHLPDFDSVTDNTPLEIWRSTRSQVISPSYYRNSTWSNFFESLPPQDPSILTG